MIRKTPKNRVWDTILAHRGVEQAITVAGQDGHPGGRHFLCNLPGSFDPVQHGHGEVHEHYLGAEPLGFLDGLSTAFRLRPKLPIRVI
jgi:hypothetical protein